MYNIYVSSVKHTEHRGVRIIIAPIHFSFYGPVLLSNNDGHLWIKTMDIFMNRIKLYSISCKQIYARILVQSGNLVLRTYCHGYFPVRIMQHLTQRAADNYGYCRRGRRRAWSRAHRSKPMFCLGGAG